MARQTLRGLVHLVSYLTNASHGKKQLKLDVLCDGYVGADRVEALGQVFVATID